MPDNIFARAPFAPVASTAGWALGVLAITIVHHVYGAWLFATPFRLHIAFVAVPAMLLIPVLVRTARLGAGPAAGWAAAGAHLLMGGFAIAAIGIYEGGYNHLLPNLQYLAGIEHTLRAGLYEPPDDLVFQGTGMLQFAVAVLAIRAYLRMYRLGGRLRLWA